MTMNRANHLFTPEMLYGLNKTMDEMDLAGLVKWRDHIIGNPYSLEGVTERIVKMLDERIKNAHTNKS